MEKCIHCGHKEIHHLGSGACCITRCRKNDLCPGFALTHEDTFGGGEGTIDKHVEYVRKAFTREGYEMFVRYTKTLIKYDQEKSTDDYPFKMGMILGIPNFGWANTVVSQRDLRHRIKAYMHILGFHEMSYELGNGTRIVIKHQMESRKGEDLK